MTIKGITPIITSDIGLLVMPEITYKTIPIGGVIKAISIFTMNNIANQIGSIPKNNKTGNKTGTII